MDLCFMLAAHNFGLYEMHKFTGKSHRYISIEQRSVRSFVQLKQIGRSPDGFESSRHKTHSGPSETHFATTVGFWDIAPQCPPHQFSNGLSCSAAVKDCLRIHCGLTNLQFLSNIYPLCPMWIDFIVLPALSFQYGLRAWLPQSSPGDCVKRLLACSYTVCYQHDGPLFM